MENHQMSGLEGTCALCLQTRALVNSHIIPEFFYRPLYDPKTHRYFQLSTEPGTRTVRRPKGLYEKLLCSECDGERLGALESYVRPILQGGVEIAIEDRADRFIVHELDYERTKLFALSLLWRAAVSKRQEFEAIQLDANDQEILRRMLMDGNPGENHEYPVSIISPPPSTGVIGEAIMPPDLLEIEGRTCCRFMLGGIFWLFIVSYNTKDFRFQYWSISQDGTLAVYKGNDSTVRFLDRLFGDFQASGNLPRPAP